jgi:hypothetical protein
VRTESYGDLCTPRPYVKTARRNLGYRILRNFTGLTMLEIDLELNTNLGAHEIMYPLTKNENFRCISQDYELYAYDRRAARF